MAKRLQYLGMMDMVKQTLEVVENIQLKEKEKLEVAYGVCIEMDVVVLACNIVRRYSNVFMSSESGDDGSLKVVLLQEKAVELLDKACAKMRNDFDTDAEEKSMDKAEYLLYSSLVELNEMKREKDPGCQSWIPRVEEEYKDLMALWERFVGKWKPLAMLRRGSARRTQEIYFMEQLRLWLISHLKSAKAAKINLLSSLVPNLNPVFSQLLQMTHENFKHNVTVTPCIIAEVASCMTGVPASWLLNYSKPPLQGLEHRLLKRLVGQDHVVKAITNSLLRTGPHGGQSRPLGSFLFLCGAPFGREELIEALAKELFDSKDFVTRFDMSDYRDLHSSSCDACFLGERTSGYNHEEHGFGGKLIEVVKSRPFGVLLFENVEKAHNYAIEILLDILRHGRLLDSQGSEVYFSNLLIIMNSDVGSDKHTSWMCKCLENDLGQPMKKKGFGRSPLFLMDHKCGFLGVFKVAKYTFKSELLEKLDDVVVFNGLSHLHYNVIARFHLRSLTDAMKQKGLILYASQAALRIMTFEALRGKVGAGWIKVWLQENVIPVLSDILSRNKIDDLATIYMDVLVGTDKLSYRLEKDGSQGDLKVFKHFKETLNELRTLYRKEKEHVSKIYNVRRKYIEVITMDGDEDFVRLTDVLQDFVNIVDDMIPNTLDVDFMCSEYKLASFNLLNEEAVLRQKELADERSKNGFAGLRTVVSERICEEAVDVVEEALSRCIHAPHNPPHHPAQCFLILGLTNAGKKDLLSHLAKLGGADRETQMIQIHMEELNDPDSFLRYLSHEEQGLGLQECVKTRQPQIVFIDQVEKADMSVFSTLLSVLDYGTLTDSHGRVVDFCNTVFIILSDLGNKEILARLVGHFRKGSIQRATTEQGGRRFRVELLNRVDEILIFNPFAQEQLRKFSRLPMRVSHHLEGSQGSFYMAFKTLFGEFERPNAKRWPVGAECAVSHLSKRLIGNWKNVVLANRSCCSPSYGGGDYPQLLRTVQCGSSLPKASV